MLARTKAFSRPRIAILLPNLRPGGAERLHVNLAHAWQKRGVEVHFLLRQQSGDLLERLPSSSIVSCLNAERVRHTFTPLVRYLKASPPDALVAAMWPLTALSPVAARVAKYSGRVIVSEHSPLSLAYAHRGQLHRWAMRLSQGVAYRLADARVAVSSGVASDLAQLSRLPVADFNIIPNPVSGGVVDSSAPRPSLLQGISGPLVLSVGTLKPVKRHDLLIEAFAQLPESMNAHLCLVGEGAERANLEQKALALGIADKVILAGYVRDPGPWFAHADLFVLCSDYEGFGNVIVEALEYGVPVVSTDCPVGPREILDNGRFGDLVPPGDVDALTKVMMQALEQDVDRDALRTRARDFALEPIAARYLEVCLPASSEDVARVDTKKGGNF